MIEVRYERGAYLPRTTCGSTPGTRNISLSQQAPADVDLTTKPGASRPPLPQGED
ncbi:MAG TPA: hypothetical protein VGQ95_02205 [Chthoniobacterales bacterium]|nr:hypothetical protein [Chthoniobacterales bacterium]